MGGKVEDPESRILCEGKDSPMTTSREQRRKSERGRRGRGWEQRAFVARSRICRTLCRVKTREEGVVSVGRWANRYLHSTYDDVNAEKRVHEEGPAQQRSPQKRFASKETLFSRGASRERFSRTKTRQRDRERRLGSMYAS